MTACSYHLPIYLVTFTYGTVFGYPKFCLIKGYIICLRFGIENWVESTQSRAIKTKSFILSKYKLNFLCLYLNESNRKK